MAARETGQPTDWLASTLMKPTHLKHEAGFVEGAPQGESFIRAITKRARTKTWRLECFFYHGLVLNEPGGKKELVKAIIAGCTVIPN